MRKVYQFYAALLIALTSRLSAQASIPFDFWSDADQLYLPGDPERPIKYNRIHSLGVGDGVDPQTFVLPIKFKNIHQIVIFGNKVMRRAFCPG